MKGIERILGRIRSGMNLNLLLYLLVFFYWFVLFYLLFCIYLLVLCP